MPSDGKNSESPTIERVFGLLDKWRHLPAYKLEPRADIFFALYLPDVLEKHFGIGNLCLIPEFPIKKSIIQAYAEDDTKQSINVDYLAVSDDLTRAFLIELKTDMMSIKEKQVRDLKCASGKGMAEIVGGLKLIAKSDSVTGSRVIRGKYFFLLKELKRLGLIRTLDVDGLRSLVTKKRMKHKDYECRISQMEIAKNVRNIKVDVVYVIPREPTDERTRYLLNDVDHQISFEEFVKYAKNRGTIGSRFAKSLEKWTKQAGSCPPQP